VALARFRWRYCIDPKRYVIDRPAAEIMSICVTGTLEKRNLKNELDLNGGVQKRINERRNEKKKSKTCGLRVCSIS
jgi:hypothetical protein